MSEQPELLTKKELAALLRISEKTVNRMVQRGTAPPSITLPGSGHRRWRRADVEAWLAEHREG